MDVRSVSETTVDSLGECELAMAGWGLEFTVAPDGVSVLGEVACNDCSPTPTPANAAAATAAATAGGGRFACSDAFVGTGTRRLTGGVVTGPEHGCMFGAGSTCTGVGRCAGVET